MDYLVTRLAIGCRNHLQIDSSIFEAIRHSRDTLSTLLLIEEDYDVLVGNYLDLEICGATIAFHSFAQPRIKRTEFDKDGRQLNRMVMNLLTSARAYIDHTKHNVSSLPAITPAEKNAVDGLFSSEYDRSFSYRVVEALRNYTQHCSLPTQGLSYPMEWKGGEEMKDQILEYSVSPLLNTTVLQTDGKFKKKLIQELESAGGTSVPVMPLLREYMAGLSSIHCEVRALFDARMEASCNMLEEWIDRYKAVATERESGFGTAGIAAISQDESGKITAAIHLGVHFRERLSTLRNANQRLTNLPKLRVTSGRG